MAKVKDKFEFCILDWILTDGKIPKFGFIEGRGGMSLEASVEA